MTVELSDLALRTLGEIWLWNATEVSPRRADAYERFLRQETSNISRQFHLGKPVPSRPALQFVTAKKARAKHGHVIVYRVSERTILVLNYYHTAQDWQNKI